MTRLRKHIRSLENDVFCLVPSFAAFSYSPSSLLAQAGVVLGLRRAHSRQRAASQSVHKHSPHTIDGTSLRTTTSLMPTRGRQIETGSVTLARTSSLASRPGPWCQSLAPMCPASSKIRTLSSLAHSRARALARALSASTAHGLSLQGSAAPATSRVTPACLLPAVRTHLCVVSAR